MRVRETRRPPHHGSRLAASVTAGMEAGRATSAMGLAFPNPLGLAAGVDRTGALIPSLNAHGFGHIEIGTITPARGYAGALGRRDARTRIGVNIGSARHGLDDQVIEDYAATLRQVYGLCDYIVANLSAPTPHRDGNTPGVETLVKRLGVARDVLEPGGMQALVQWMDQHNCREKALGLARSYLDQAQQALELLPAGTQREPLEELLQYVMRREH